MNAGYSREFVDTNILVYAHDQSAGIKHERAKSLVMRLWKSKAGHISIQVLQEFYVVITRKVPKPLSSPLAAQIIADLSSWKTYVPVVEDVLGAIDIQQRSQLSFWDAMILRSAKKMGCEVIWSEDFGPGRSYEGVLVLNPLVEE